MLNERFVVRCLDADVLDTPKHLAESMRVKHVAIVVRFVDERNACV